MSQPTLGLTLTKKNGSQFQRNQLEARGKDRERAAESVEVGTGDALLFGRSLITEFMKEGSPLLPSPCHHQDYDRSMFPPVQPGSEGCPPKICAGVISDFGISYISWDLISPVIRLITFRADTIPARAPGKLLQCEGQRLFRWDLYNRLLWGSGSTFPLSSGYGTYTAVKARFWPWPSFQSDKDLSRCPLLARKRHILGYDGGRWTIQERCPARQTSRVERLVAKVEPLST